MTNNKLERILTKECAEEFKTLLGKRTNTKVNKYFEQVIEHYLSDLNRQTVQKDLTDPSWPLVRAYRDGGRFYLQQLLELFKEK